MASEVERSDPGSIVVARVDGEPVRVVEVAPRAPGPRGQRDPRQRVEAVIERRLVVREARRRHLDELPRVEKRIATLRREAARRENTALRNALFRTVRDGIDLTESELQQHYQETESQYFERQIHLRWLAFDSEEAARTADAALGPSGRLDPDSAEDLGPTALRDLSRSVLPAALQLKKPGERVVIRKAEEWGLVELVETLPASQLSFEQVRGRVEASLRSLRARDAFAELVERLRSEAEIEIDELVISDETLWSRGGGAE